MCEGKVSRRKVLEKATIKYIAEQIIKGEVGIGYPVLHRTVEDMEKQIEEQKEACKVEVVEGDMKENVPEDILEVWKERDRLDSLIMDHVARLDDLMTCRDTIKNLMSNYVIEHENVNDVLAAMENLLEVLEETIKSTPKLFSEDSDE